MKKSNILLLAATAVVALFSACSESEVLVDNENVVNTRKDAIDFGIAVPQNSTRASYSSGSSFQSGDVMAVDGFQDATTQIFKNQAVTSQGGTAVWTYNPVKYWQKGSSYDFYAFFPFDIAHSFGTADAPYYTVPTYTVSDDKDSQRDLMIAKKPVVKAFNTVDFVFNHILSNVNFYFAVSPSFNTTGISSVNVNSFDVTGLYNTGAYAQTGFSAASAPVGAWSSQSGTYDFPAVTSGTAPCTLSEDLLLLPQTIADDARIALTYTLAYEDGSSTTFSKSVRLASIVGTSAANGDQVISTWEPNVRYNYTMAINPSVSNIVSEDVDWNGTIDGDKVGNGDLIIEGGSYWIDTNGDGAGDFPVVFEDVDGDGWLEGGVDRNKDGKIDDVDQDGTTVTDGTATGDKSTEPSDGTTTGEHAGKDVILIDTDDDGVPDTQLVKPGTSNADDVVENEYLVDYDGTLNGEQTPTTKVGKIAADDASNPYNNATSVYYQADNTDIFYYVDVDGDGTFDNTVDYAVVWKNIDDDDKLEGIADYNRDGIANDNIDGDNAGYSVDADATNNPDGLDVILADEDLDGVAETQLERDPNSSDTDENTKNPVIEFTATVEDWADEYDANVVVKE